MIKRIYRQRISFKATSQLQKMRWFSILLVLGLHACVSGSVDDDKSEEEGLARRKLEHLIEEAKKIATRTGTDRTIKDKRKREKTLLGILEEYEAKLSARKLDSMKQARACGSWGCFDMKATNATTTTTSAPPTPPPPTTQTTTPSWNDRYQAFLDYLRRLFGEGFNPFG